MTIIDKIEELQENHFIEWIKMRRDVASELSDKYPMFCICGRLATGLHEGTCRKLQSKINDETANRLGCLLSTQK